MGSLSIDSFLQSKIKGFISPKWVHYFHLLPSCLQFVFINSTVSGLLCELLVPEKQRGRFMEHGIHLWRLWGIRYIEWTISWDIRQRKFCPKMTIPDHAERTCDFFFLKRKLSGMNSARQEKIPQVWWDNASPAWKGIFWEALILSLLREQDGQLQRGWAMPSRLFQKHTQVFSEEASRSF